MIFYFTVSTQLKHWNVKVDDYIIYEKAEWAYVTQIRLVRDFQVHVQVIIMKLHNFQKWKIIYKKNYHLCGKSQTEE